MLFSFLWMAFKFYHNAKKKFFLVPTLPRGNAYRPSYQPKTLTHHLSAQNIIPPIQRITHHNLVCIPTQSVGTSRWSTSPRLTNLNQAVLPRIISSAGISPMLG